MKKIKKSRFTKNKYGSMFPLSKYTRQFLRYVKKHKGNVLDIGAAYGVTSLPALRYGAKVTAIDLDAKQLAILKNAAGKKYARNLKIKVGHFPEVMQQQTDEQYDAILASHILHFLSPKEFRFALKTMYRLLKPQGKIFVQCFTPWHCFMAAFIPVYQKNKRQHKPWPGLTRQSSRYTLMPGKLPQLVNLMDTKVLRREFKRANFIIEQCEIFPCPRSLGKKLFVLDGREWAGVIAHK